MSIRKIEKVMNSIYEIKSTDYKKVDSKEDDSIHTLMILENTYMSDRYRLFIRRKKDSITKRYSISSASFSTRQSTYDLTHLPSIEAVKLILNIP